MRGRYGGLCGYSGVDRQCGVDRGGLRCCCGRLRCCSEVASQCEIDRGELHCFSGVNLCILIFHGFGVKWLTMCSSTP
uniref:Uncharacterized protein n=1 Tax=Physcomitrium patens TaxID=3218 RepID=A0A2K1IXU9_PHYPA|nr:hypothetical protein PHYPA_023907 [Physcomitrium patens]